MKITIDLRSALIGLVAGVVLMFTLGATGDSATAVQTEYRVVHGSVFDGDLQRNLSNAATEGWKLEESDSITARSAYAVMSRVKR
jgi:hypothetical protein